jgi:hypothetical protein
MSDELMATAPSGGGAPRIRTAGLIHSEGTEATRKMREQAKRRREADAKLPLHLMETRNKSAGTPAPAL